MATATPAPVTPDRSPAPASPELALPDGLSRVTFAAMGTTVNVLLPRDQATAAGNAVQDLFARWEAALSRFRPESDLSRLNAGAGRAVPVGDLLWDALDTAMQAAHATGGLYDPALQRQMVVLGYDRSFELLHDRSARARDQESTSAVQSGDTPGPAIVGPLPGPGGGWRAIRRDPARRTVTLPAGTGLDLGGLAKGMAVDAALAELQAQGVACALVEAGGDLAVLGRPAGTPDWPIAITEPDLGWVVALRHGAIATSGSARRRWRQGSAERHHLLDPRTGRPAYGDLRSVSIAAARCAQAEAAAKAAFLLGAEHGARFIEAHGLAGLLVRWDGTWLTAGPWPTAMGGRGT